MAEDQLIVLGGPLFRKPGTTREEFTKGWRRHAEVVIPWFLEFGVTEYSQIHLPLTMTFTSCADDSSPQRLDNQESEMTQARDILSQADGVAFVKCLPLRSSSGVEQPFGDGFEHPYFLTVIVEDETRFLHPQSGAGAVKGGASFPKLPEVSGGAANWRRIALEIGGQEYIKIKGGKEVVDDVC